MFFFQPISFISNCDIYNTLKIYSGEFEFDSPYWDEISVDAKEFIRQLMCVDVDKRLSCEEALEHAWYVLTSYPN